MKTKFLLFFLLMSGISHGQMSISYSDYLNYFSPGAVYVTYSTPINGPDVSVFIGEASSSSQYWDFTNYSFDNVGKSWGIEPSTAPLINDFPEANLVTYEKVWIPGLDTIYSWNYKHLQSDKLLMLGVSNDTSALILYNPPAEQAMVPFEYGESWISQRDSNSIMPGFYIIIENHSTIDAFGTMKIPSGEYPCLRVLQNNLTITHTPVSIDTVRTRGYAFYAKGLMEVNVLGVPEDQFDLSTVVVRSFKISMRQGESGINENGSLSDLFVLNQNRPNPVQKSTVISWQMSAIGHVVLRICDLTGKERRILVNEKMLPGEHKVDFDASGLPSGVYTYQLQVNGVTEIKKMVVLNAHH